MDKTEYREQERTDIRQYGAQEGGSFLCTEAIERAALQGGEVYIPKGVYLTGAVFLKSNMSLYLEKGAAQGFRDGESAGTERYITWIKRNGDIVTIWNSGEFTRTAPYGSTKSRLGDGHTADIFPRSGRRIWSVW